MRNTPDHNGETALSNRNAERQSPATPAPIPSPITSAPHGLSGEASGSSFVAAIKRLFRGQDASLIAMILANKGLVLLFGFASYAILKNEDIETEGLNLWNRWDAVSYQKLAEHGYQATGEDRFTLVFFPLYPWLTRFFALPFGRNYLISAFFVSGIASIAAGLLLYRLLRLDETSRQARRAVWFLFIFPTSYFLHIGYTESLFLALVIGSFLAARRERWGVAGLLGAFAGLTRINGLLLVPALGFEALQHYRQDRRWRWGWLWIALPMLGFVGYLLLNYHVSGDPFTFLKFQQEHWSRSIAWPWVGVSHALKSLSGGTPADAQMVGGQELLFAAFGFICLVWSLLELRPAYSVWIALNWLLFTSTSLMVSVPRYTLTMFPIFLLLSKLSRDRLWNSVITTWSLLFLALFIGRFVTGAWAF